MSTIRQQATKYALGVLAAIAALLLRRLLDPFLGAENPYHTAWAAVAFSAWYCGMGPAIVTVVITLLGVWYWFLAPYDTFALHSRAQVFGMVGFLAVSAVMVLFAETARRSAIKRGQTAEQLKIIHDELEERVRERTAELELSREALRQKTAQAVEQAAMLDSANDAIFVRSAADTISYWNMGAQRLYGWTKDEVLGRSANDLLHSQFPIPLDEIKQMERWEGELRQKKRDGSWITVASRWTTLRDNNNNPTGWLEINTDVTIRKQAEEATRSLTARLLTLQDEERRRIARELHDSLGQYLAALKMSLDSFPSSNMQQAAIVSECAKIVEQCLSETRTVSHLLHPPLLDEAGLGSAIRLYSEEFSRRSGIAVNLAVAPDLKRLPADLEIALFRAVQEGLTNVHRHAEASTVDIRLTVDSGRIRLEIRDNGRGVPRGKLDRLAERATGVGLAGMRERFREFGGTVEVKSGKAGTGLNITTPITSRTS